MRWRIEFVLAGIFATLTLLTSVWPTWIESVLNASPDGGTGAGERWVALLFGVGALAAAAIALRDRRAAGSHTSARTTALPRSADI